MIPHQSYPWTVYKGGNRYVSISLAIFVISGKINKGFRQLVIIGNFQDMSPPSFVLPQEFIGVNSDF